MPFGIVSPPMASSSKSPMMLSSKEEPAVAMIAPAAFQPLGVSESELEEMWGLLQDDAIDQDAEYAGGEQTMLLGEAWSGDPDSALAGWNNFGSESAHRLFIARTQVLKLRRFQFQCLSTKLLFR
jgi:hypothetical protein